MTRKEFACFCCFWMMANLVSSVGTGASWPFFFLTTVPPIFLVAVINFCWFKVIGKGR